MIGVGTIIGALTGLGSLIGSVASYNEARQAAQTQADLTVKKKNLYEGLFQDEVKGATESAKQVAAFARAQQALSGFELSSPTFIKQNEQLNREFSQLLREREAVRDARISGVNSELQAINSSVPSFASQVISGIAGGLNSFNVGYNLDNNNLGNKPNANPSKTSNQSQF